MLLGIAFVLFFIKTPYREAFMFVSCAIFLTLSLVLFSDYDVTYLMYAAVDDGSTVITSNATHYIIGNPTIDFNDTSKFLATFLLVIGIVTGLVSFVMFIRTDNTK
jgi:hypothetical protein